MAMAFRRRAPSALEGLAQPQPFGVSDAGQSIVEGDNPMPQIDPVIPNVQRPGFFGEGGTGRAIAGYIGDFLAQQGGGQPVYQQNMMLQRQDERDARKQQQAWEQWRQQYDYQVKNPRPSTAQPYRFESNSGDVYELGGDGVPKKVFTDPDEKKNFIPDGMGGGQWVAVPRSLSQGGGDPNLPATGGAPLKPAGKLTPIGGQTPPASGNFPR